MPSLRAAGGVRSAQWRYRAGGLGAANMLFWRVLVDDGYALAGLALISCSFVFAVLHFLAAGSGLRPAFAMK